MSNRYVIEALLRPAVELNTAVVSGMAAYVCVQAPGCRSGSDCQLCHRSRVCGAGRHPHASGDEDYSLPPESPPPDALCHEY